jgi:hypothetical protein
MGTFLRDIYNDARGMLVNLRGYLFGRGIVSTIAMAVGALSSGIFGATATALTPAFAVALVGGVVLSGFMRVREMQRNQDKMADIYRDEIADQLGIAPQQVTRAHVHLMAYGDERRGIASNAIVREEIEREWSKTWLRFATSTLAAMTSFAVISFGLGLPQVTETLAQLVPAGVQSFFPSINPILATASVGLVSGFTGLLVNRGLDIGVQRSTTLGNLTLHDRIAKLDRDITRARTVTKEQVFALFVAANPVLSERISQRFGRSYDLLPQAQKSAIIVKAGSAQQMQAIANDLNQGNIRAGTVAFIVSGQHTVENPAQLRDSNESVVREPEKTRFAERFSASNQTAGLSYVDREVLRRSSMALDGAAR